jgi:hypothetical protein
MRGRGAWGGAEGLHPNSGTPPPRPTRPPPEPPVDLGEFNAGSLRSTPIPPRSWLLGNLFCQQYISMLFGDGAAGKTAHRIACALALATGRREIIDQHIFYPEGCRVLFLCFEDGLAELQRRLVAAMIKWDIADSNLDDRLYYRAISRADLKFTKTRRNGDVSPGRLGDAITRTIDARGIQAVFLDPMIKTHDADENDNKAIDYLAEIVTGLCIDKDVAIDFTHHTRKGSAADPGNADSGRGAGAGKNAGRLVSTFTTMSPEDAQNHGISEADRRLLRRMDAAKVNIAPPAEHATWYQLVGVNIGNGTERYPNGDNVQVCVPYTLADPKAKITVYVANAILDRIAAGPEPGRHYSARKGVGEDRMLWPIVEQICGFNEHQTGVLVQDWLKTGVVKYQSYYDKPTKNQAAQGLVVLRRPG